MASLGWGVECFSALDFGFVVYCSIDFLKTYNGENTTKTLTLQPLQMFWQHFYSTVSWEVFYHIYLFWPTALFIGCHGNQKMLQMEQKRFKIRSCLAYMVQILYIASLGWGLIFFNETQLFRLDFGKLEFILTYNGQKWKMAFTDYRYILHFHLKAEAWPTAYNETLKKRILYSKTSAAMYLLRFL